MRKVTNSISKLMHMYHWIMLILLATLCFLYWCITQRRTLVCIECLLSEFVLYVKFMTQSINVKYVLVAISIPVSFHSHAMFVSVFNGLNFFDWSEQVQISLRCIGFLIWVFKLRNILLLMMLVAMKRKLIIGLGKSLTDLIWCLCKWA